MRDGVVFVADVQFIEVGNHQNRFPEALVIRDNDLNQRALWCHLVNVVGVISGHEHVSFRIHCNPHRHAQIPVRIPEDHRVVGRDAKQRPLVVRVTIVQSVLSGSAEVLDFITLGFDGVVVHQPVVGVKLPNFDTLHAGDEDISIKMGDAIAAVLCRVLSHAIQDGHLGFAQFQELDDFHGGYRDRNDILPFSRRQDSAVPRIAVNDAHLQNMYFYIYKCTLFNLSY